MAQFLSSFAAKIIPSFAATAQKPTMVDALDSFTPTQLGENGNPEYAWSNDLQELLLQISFQMVRTKDSTGLKTKLVDFMRQASAPVQSGSEMASAKKALLTIAFKMIAQVRDVTDGKGECDLGYMQILVWNDFYPAMARFALNQFVNAEGHPYGSWKDVKRFCAYAVAHGVAKENPIIAYALALIGLQIREDMAPGATTLSLAAKWVPRETSKQNGWMFKIIAKSYYPEIMQTADDADRRRKASIKCCTLFRKVLSDLNRRLDTVQIKQCANTWADIDHGKVTSITITKQKNALLNKRKDGSQRSELEDRITCADNFKARIAAAVKGEVVIKGKRVGMDTFTQEALDIIGRGCNDADRIAIINSQWKDSSSLTGELGAMVAVVDTSGSMFPEAILAAIALGIRVAEHSLLGKRVMTFSSTPKWHNLDHCDGFVDTVKSLKEAEWAMSTCFRSCMELFLDAAVQKNLSPEQVKGMTIAVFSDMQIDSADRNGTDATMHEAVRIMYHDVGMKAHGIPYEPPHMLYWNLRSRNGTPCLSSVKNVSMLSGYSPSLLNLFCEKGVEGLMGSTPWTMLVESLAKPRYQCMEDKANELL